MSAIIRVENVHFSYPVEGKNAPPPALSGVELTIAEGEYVAIVGQDCIPEALKEISSTDSPLIGSVSHEAQSYGPRLIHLGLALLSGHRVAPYNYVEHKLVTGSWLRESGRTA